MDVQQVDALLTRYYTTPEAALCETILTRCLDALKSEPLDEPPHEGVPRNSASETSQK